MNNRDYKNFAPKACYHVFNRGVGKMDIFKDEDDFKFFLYRLKENLFPLKNMPFAEKNLGGSYIRKSLPADAFTLLCYCLMPNHFHLLIRQNGDTEISKLVSKICTSYSKYFNKKYGRVGHLFQDAFKSVLIKNDSQLAWLSAYIHQNPKVSGIVESLKKYQWSSYLDYLGVRNGTLCEKKFILDMQSSDGYESFVENSYERIRERKDLEKLLIDE
ncbi:MAG: transposase [Candidatus Doudnabacteria bacterium]|nr:transposase [Candidatus Doudnabacteria bacterium]